MAPREASLLPGDDGSSAHELADEQSRLAELSERELLVRFCSDGDLTARELLFEKRVLADRFLANVTHDYAHYVAAQHLGGGRLHKPFHEIPKPYAYKRLGKPTGVVTASGQRLQLRTRTIRDLNRSGNGYFSLPAPRWRLEFNAMLMMLFGSAFAVAGAWIVPWDVVDEYGKPSGLRVLGPWIDDPRVDQLSLGASYRLS